MPGCWEVQPAAVLAAVLHTEITTVAWSFGIRNLQLPGQFIGLAGMPFDHARNQACYKALECGATHLFFLDSDTIPPPDAVMKLLAHDKPLISGMYCRRSPPAGLPVMQRNYQWITELPDLTNPNVDPVVEVDVVGTGCMLIRRDLLLNFPPLDAAHGKHWFHWRVDMAHSLPKGEAMSEDFVFCFNSGMWIAGNKMRSIEDVKVGHHVFTHTGQLKKVVGVFSRPYHGRMIRIKPVFLGSVECTPGHKFLVKSRTDSGVEIESRIRMVSGILISETATIQNVWIEAENLRTGDMLAIPKIYPPEDGVTEFHLSKYVDLRSLHTFPDGRLGYKRTRKSALRLKPEIGVTPDLCRLLGYYISQGNPNAKSQALYTTFNEKYQNHTTDCRDLLRQIFGAECGESQGVGCLSLIVSSKLLTSLFIGLCGKGSRNKRLPPFWTKLNRECLIELIKGYWRGDGYWGCRQISMNTVSIRLAREVQSALLRLGIVSGFSVSINDYGKVYSLGIPIFHQARFVEIFGSRDGKYEAGESQHKQSMQDSEDYFYIPVREVTKFPFDGQVYNLKVEEDESYTVNTVAVHNCQSVRKMGIPVLVDTSIKCRHVGYAQAEFGSFVPLIT